MVMDIRKTLLLVKGEVTYDTDPTPTGAANAILASGVTVDENFAALARGEQWPSLDHLPSVAGAKYASIKFSTPICLSGVAGTAPRLGALLKACAHSETVISSTSVTYAPVSANHGSCTIYVYMDGRLQKFTGCMGDAKFSFPAGKMAEIAWTFVGRYADPTASALVTPTYETTIKTPVVCKSMTLSYNAKTTLVVATGELDLGIKVINRENLADPNGIAGFEITDRDPKITIDPETIASLTDFNFRSDWLNTTRAVIMGAGLTAGNIITVNAPQFMIEKLTPANRNGIATEKIEGQCAASAGDDSYSIVLT